MDSTFKNQKKTSKLNSKYKEGKNKGQNEVNEISKLINPKTIFQKINKTNKLLNRLIRIQRKKHKLPISVMREMTDSTDINTGHITKNLMPTNLTIGEREKSLKDANCQS